MAGRIVIVGGGAVGSAVAYWLTADPARTCEVVVVERDPTYRQASSALSASAVRQQYSTPVNIAIGRFGFAFLREAAERLAVGNDRPVGGGGGGGGSLGLGDGSELACDALVNAAGPWAARVAAMAGVELPVRARRRTVFVLDCPDPPQGCPLVIDPSGF